ncbi:MAG: hypothetical protein H7222_04765 [Methylotenera sp.]|nr:hypothetical protein [Oligoflexia bacterium]
MCVHPKLLPVVEFVAVLALFSACSHAPEIRSPANAAVEDSGHEITGESADESHDEFYKFLSAYPDGVAVAGYARAYHERLMKDEAWQEVAAPFIDYITIASDFEMIVDGPVTLQCVQGTTFRGKTEVFMLPVVHALESRSVQVFSIVQKAQPRLYPQILCKYSGPGDHLDFKITIRFPTPRRILTEEGELLRRMRSHLLADALTLTAEEKNWIRQSGIFHSGKLKITPLVPQALLNFEQPDEFLILQLAAGPHLLLEQSAKGIYRLIAPSKGFHFTVSAEELEFPSIRQNVLVCADANDRVLIEGDRENELMTKGFQGSIRCLINTPKGDPSRWKGRFDVRVMRIPVDVLLGKIEEILRPLELETIELDLELASERITELRQRFEEKAVGYPRSRYDLLYKLASEKNPPPFKALRRPQLEE